jgi:hypothetical protein
MDYTDQIHWWVFLHTASNYKTNSLEDVSLICHTSQFTLSDIPPPIKVPSASDLNQVLCSVETGRSASNNAYFWYRSGSGCQPPLWQETLMVTVVSQPQKLHAVQPVRHTE